MKRKILQNSLVVATMAMTLCLSAAVLVTSCQKDNFEDELSSPQSSKTKTGLPYLEFKTGYTGVGQPSEKDWEVIMQVSKRVKITKVDGLWEMNINSATEINVAPGIFTFLSQAIENSNAKIRPNLTTMSIAPRLKKPGDIDPEENINRSDCVASCFGWIHNNMGFGPTYNSSNSWINNQFGGGVPSNQMESTLKHFYGPNNVSSFPVNSQPNGSWYKESNSAVILNYHPNGDTTGHAVIYQGTGDGTHWVVDPQAGGSPQIVDTTDVISAYKVTK